MENIEQQTQPDCLYKVNEEKENLLWGVRRSIRYHDRRRRFFDLCHSLVMISGIMLATISFASVMNERIDESWLWVFSILSMCAFLLDLLFRFSYCAHYHTTLKHRFSELEKSIITSKQEDMAAFTAQRLEIEKDEPPIRRALDILCHNELAKSREDTNQDIYRVSFLQRITSQLFTWPNISAKRVGA